MGKQDDFTISTIFFLLYSYIKTQESTCIYGVHVFTIACRISYYNAIITLQFRFFPMS